MKAVVTILTLALLLAGCSGSGGESGGGNAGQGAQGGEPVEPKTAGPTAPAFDAVVGDPLEQPDYTVRVLDVVESQNWHYMETSGGSAVDATSMAGKFVTVWYSVRNTGSYPLTLDLSATLAAGGQYFQESEDVQHPRGAWQLDLAPNDTVITGFIFDVPRDAKPEVATIIEGRPEAPTATLAEVDLTSGNLGEIRPEETLALSWEYMNAGQFGLAYDLYSSEAQAQVSLDQFTRGNDTGWSTSDYAFPSIEISGDQATVERVLTAYNPQTFETDQSRAVQPLVREDGAWRISMRPDQLEYFRQV